jgi:hypothetical protein
MEDQEIYGRGGNVVEEGDFQKEVGRKGKTSSRKCGGRLASSKWEGWGRLYIRGLGGIFYVGGEGRLK